MSALFLQVLRQEIGLKVSVRRDYPLVAPGKTNAAAFMPNGATLGWQQKRKKIEKDGGRKKGTRA